MTDASRTLKAKLTVQHSDVAYIASPAFDPSWVGGWGQQVYGANWYSQTFTATASEYLRFVEIYFSPNGVTTGVNVSLRATSGGAPTGPDLASGVIPYSKYRTYAMNRVEFTTPYLVTAGTVYAIVVSIPSGDASHYVYLWFASPSGHGTMYSGGNPYQSTNSGSSWSVIYTNYADFRFNAFVIGAVRGYFFVGHDGTPVELKAKFVVRYNVSPYTFADGLESGDGSRWNYVYSSTVTSDDKHSGTYSLRTDAPIGTYNAYAGKYLVNYWPEYYSSKKWRASTWVKITENPLLNNGETCYVFWLDYTQVYLYRHGDGVTRWMLNVQFDNYGTWKYTTVEATLDVWHHVELRVFAGASGYVELWVDDELIATAGPASLTQYILPSYLYIGFGRYNATGGYHAYYDDALFLSEGHLKGKFFVGKEGSKNLKGSLGVIQPALLKGVFRLRQDVANLIASLTVRHTYDSEFSEGFEHGLDRWIIDEGPGAIYTQSDVKYSGNYALEIEPQNGLYRDDASFSPNTEFSFWFRTPNTLPTDYISIFKAFGDERWGYEVLSADIGVDGDRYIRVRYNDGDDSSIFYFGYALPNTWYKLRILFWENYEDSGGAGLQLYLYDSFGQELNNSGTSGFSPPSQHIQHYILLNLYESDNAFYDEFYVTRINTYPNIPNHPYASFSLTGLRDSSWQDGFERGNLSRWTGGSSDIIIQDILDGGYVANGRYAALLGDGNYDSLYLWNPNCRPYERFTIRFKAMFLDELSDNDRSIYRASGWDSSFLGFWYENYGTPRIGMWNWDGPNAYGNWEPELEHWHLFELTAELNRDPAHITLKIDGDLIIDQDDAITGPSRWLGYLLGHEFYGSPEFTIVYDDVEIFIGDPNLKCVFTVAQGREELKAIFTVAPLSQELYCSFSVNQFDGEQDLKGTFSLPVTYNSSWRDTFEGDLNWYFEGSVTLQNDVVKNGAYALQLFGAYMARDFLDKPNAFQTNGAAHLSFWWRKTGYESLSFYYMDWDWTWSFCLQIDPDNGRIRIYDYDENDYLFNIRLWDDMWYFIEIDDKIGMADGALTVKINGITIISESGIRTDTGRPLSKILFGTDGNYYLDDFEISNEPDLKCTFFIPVTESKNLKAHLYVPNIRSTRLFEGFEEDTPLNWWKYDGGTAITEDGTSVVGKALELSGTLIFRETPQFDPGFELSFWFRTPDTYDRSTNVIFAAGDITAERYKPLLEIALGMWTTEGDPYRWIEYFTGDWAHEAGIHDGFYFPFALSTWYKMRVRFIRGTGNGYVSIYIDGNEDYALRPDTYTDLNPSTRINSIALIDRVVEKQPGWW